MRRDRDSRRPQRRGFDDDNFAPPPRDFSYPPRGPSTGARQEVPSGPPVQATVRWYNPEKGFGFVQLADTGGDAFLHVSVVERAGHANIPPGATLEVRTAPGQKGPQVTEILNLDTSTVAPTDGRVFDPTQIVQIGIQFTTGDPYEGGTLTFGQAVFEIDTVQA